MQANQIAPNSNNLLRLVNGHLIFQAPQILQAQTSGVAAQSFQPIYRSIPAKEFSCFNLFHWIFILFGISTRVNHLGQTLLINPSTIRQHTGASNEQIENLIRQRELMTFVTVSIAMQAFNQQLTPTMYSTMKNTSSFNHLTGDRTSPVYIGFNQRGEIELLKINKTLGKGSFGKVVELENLVTGQTEAFKYARKEAGQEGIEDVQTEFSTHQQRFPNGNKVWGFVNPLREQASIPLLRKNPHSPDGSIRVVTGNRGEQYQQDYVDGAILSTLTFEETLVDCHQMLYTLYYMEGNQSLYGDYKADNFFMKTIDGRRITHLGDLASWQFYDGTQPLNPAGSPAYTVWEDYDELLGMLQNPYASDPDEIRALQGKRDIFALGATIYAGLAKKYPYKLADRVPPQGGPEEPLPVWRSNADYRPIAGIPNAMNDLLRDMTDFNHRTRIGRTEAWQRFNLILDQYPHIRQQITENMTALGYNPNI